MSGGDAPFKRDESLVQRMARLFSEGCGRNSWEAAVQAKLACIERDQHAILVNVHQLLKGFHVMAVDFTNLIDKITNMESVQQGAITLLNTLATEIRNLPTGDTAQTQAAIQELANRIDQDTQQLSSAVVVNTDPHAPTDGGDTGGNPLR